MTQTATLARLDYGTADAAHAAIDELISSTPATAPVPDPAPPAARAATATEIAVEDRTHAASLNGHRPGGGTPARAVTAAGAEPDTSQQEDDPDPGDRDAELVAAARRIVAGTRHAGTRLSQIALAEKLRSEGYKVANNRLRWLAAVSGLEAGQDGEPDARASGSEYPRQLSRGLALVKWWLLAIPQYVIIALFTGSGRWFGSRLGYQDGSWGGAGLIGTLAVIAAVVLLVTGRYPDQIFDFVLGMNRWVLRVAAYAGLMTDRYPPFRLDMGGHDPGTLTLRPAAQAPAEPADPPLTGPRQEFLGQGFVGQADSGPTGGPAGRGGWTTARIISVVAGAVLALFSLGLLGAGSAALWAQTQRHGGYVNLGTASYSAPGYALASDTVGMHMASGGWDGASALVGTVRIRITPVGGSSQAFVGIAPAGAAARYLSGVAYATVRGVAGHQGTYTGHAGSAPAVPPVRAGIWTAQAAGPGTQTLTWAVKSGDWMLVAMNADGSRPVSMQVNVAATLPALPWIATGLLVGGFVFLVAGVLLIAVPVRRAS